MSAFDIDLFHFSIFFESVTIAIDSNRYCFEFEQQFELEQLLLLRSAHARRRPWEPPDTLIVVKFQVGGPLFWERFSEWFFSQKWCQIEPQMASTRSQNLFKNELETKSTKHVGNVPNLTPLDLQETRVRMAGLSKTTKTRGADKYKQIQKMASD